MSTYVYESRAGERIEVEYPIGTAPASVRRKKKRYKRAITIPNLKTLSPLDRGDKPSISHQLPRWYGYGQRETVWKEHMQKLGLDDTPHRRRQLAQCDMGPDPRYIMRRSREAALKAGKADKFTKGGKPLATTKRGVGFHLDTAKKFDDPVGWD